MPAGRYAEEALKHFGLWEKLQARLVYGESVRQVLDYVARGEVDAGKVYVTDARARAADVRVLLKAPPESYAPVIYPMAVVAGSSHDAEARRFLAFVSAPENRPLFEKYGFVVAG